MTLLTTCARQRAGFVVLLACMLALTGCDQLGIDTPEKIALRKGAEAKAIGGACRHAMRAIEDCYRLNPKAEKAAVFEGWREMDEYMRENKIDGVAPAASRSGADDDVGVLAASATARVASSVEDEAEDAPAPKRAKN